MHATLHFFTQMLFRRAFNYSPFAPSSLANGSSADFTSNTAAAFLSKLPLLYYLNFPYSCQFLSCRVSGCVPRNYPLKQRFWT